MARKNRKTVDAPTASEVDSTAAAPESPVAETVQQERPMTLTLTRGKTNKSGKRTMYASAQLPVGIPLAKRLFANGVFPETVTLDLGDAIQTLSAEDQAKAEARAAKRAAKGEKPETTPEQRAAIRAERQAKLEAKLVRMREANARLEAKLAAKQSNATVPAQITESEPETVVQ